MSPSILVQSQSKSPSPSQLSPNQSGAVPSPTGSHWRVLPPYNWVTNVVIHEFVYVCMQSCISKTSSDIYSTPHSWINSETRDLWWGIRSPLGADQNTETIYLSMDLTICIISSPQCQKKRVDSTCGGKRVPGGGMINTPGGDWFI